MYCPALRGITSVDWIWCKTNVDNIQYTEQTDQSHSAAIVEAAEDDEVLIVM